MRPEVDTDQDQVQPYQAQKPMTELPGIYFVDANVVVELLQGEVKPEQITKAVRGDRPQR